MDLALDRTTSITSVGPEPPSPGGSSYPATNMALHVGVLHYSPTWEPFPLLADLSRWAGLRARASVDPRAPSVQT